jgi:FolB domain-containing protein
MNPSTRISIHQLELNLSLGWSEEERVRKQVVWVDIEIGFEKPPGACGSDEIEGTLCYDTLVQTIVEQIVPRSFRLIEHLAHEIYGLVKKAHSEPLLVKVCVTKKPRLSSAVNMAGVSFSYGDS